MKTILQVTELLRRNNSSMGNPNYELVGYENGERSSYRTSSNIADSYGTIPNHLRYASEEEPVTVELTLTKSYRITNVKVLSEV